MILDGKKLASEILARAKTRAERLPHPPRIAAVVADEVAARSYLSIKMKSAAQAGCSFEVVPLGASFEVVDAALIQLPLPPEIDRQAVLDTISIAQDADVLSSAAREKFERGDEDALLPPVVAAIAEIFEKYNINPRGKRVIVIGQGFLVGKPVAIWLRQKLAAVSIVTESTNLARHLSVADIIVSGAGVARLIKPEMIKDDVVLIDAGTSESDG